jgi:RNA polymerase sigma-70 factor, ECF subfamily
VNLEITQYCDEELAAEAQTGSRRCFEELVNRYARRLFLFLRHRVSTEQDTEDLVQETFLKAFRNIHHYDHRYKFSTWIYTVAQRLAISHYRKGRGGKNTETDIPASLASEDNPQEDFLRQTDRENLWAAAQGLQPNQYQALWLRYVEELSLKEIAEVMKKNQVHVRVLLHRARLWLSKELTLPETEPEADDDMEAVADGSKNLSFLSFFL